MLDSFDPQIWLQAAQAVSLSCLPGESHPFLIWQSPCIHRKIRTLLFEGPVHLKSQWPPKVPFFLLRPLVGCGGSHSLHPKQNYSAGLNSTPAHPSFKRRTNSYWPQVASPQLLRKCISPSVSGRPISLLYHRDRLTSVQNLPRNEADKEALLWLFSRAHFFPPLLPLGLVKLVWAAYQGPREPHQSAWINSVVFGAFGVTVRRLQPPPTCSDHSHICGTAPQQQATHPCPARGSCGEGKAGEEELILQAQSTTAWQAPAIASSQLG